MKKNQSFKKYIQVWGVLIALLGAIMFSTKAVFVKLAYQYEIDSITLLLFRMLISLPVFLGIALYHSRKQGSYKPSRREYLQIILLGIIGYYLASLLDFLGLQYISASLERLILFIYPTIVVFLGMIFFKERLNRSQIIALICSYVGISIVFVFNVEVGEQKDILLGAILVCLSAVFYSVYLVGSGRLLPKMGTWLYTSYVLSISSMAVIIHYFIYKGGLGNFDYPTQVYVYAVLMATVSTALPTFLVSEGIRLIGASNTAIIGSSGPISTIVLAYIFLGERLSYFQMLGGLLVLAGVLFISLQQKKKKEAASKATTPSLSMK